MSLDFKRNAYFTSNSGEIDEKFNFFQLRIEASSVTLVHTFTTRSDSQMDFKGPISLFNCSVLNCARAKNWKIFVNLREIGKSKEKWANFETKKTGKFGKK